VVEEEPKEYTVDGDASPLEIEDETVEEATEYSVSGWFKFILPPEEQAKECHLIFRLANNNEELLGDAKELGDRTLAAFYCSEINFATYHIGTIDAGF
jgi:hypothetical protein